MVASPARRAPDDLGRRRDVVVAERTTRGRTLDADALHGSADRAARLRDLAVDLLDARLLAGPERRIRERAELVHGLALLLDPREVLLVVPALARRPRALEHPVRPRVVEP